MKNPSSMRPKADGGGARNKNGEGTVGFGRGSGPISSSPTPTADYDSCCDALAGTAKGSSTTPEKNPIRGSRSGGGMSY